MQNVGVYRCLFALHLQTRPGLGVGVRWQTAIRLSPDENTTDGCLPLQTRSDVDRITDDCVGDVAGTAHLSDLRFACVYADPQPGPVGMRGGQTLHLTLEFEAGPGGPDGVVGLVSSAVEGRHDGVSHELLDLASELPR